jgi:hypothetical protein
VLRSWLNVYASTCVHKHMFGNPKSKVCFNLCWWGNHYGLSILVSFHVHSWKHVPVLLTLEQMLNGGRTNNVKKVVMGIVLQFGNLSKSNIASKLMIWHGWHFNFLRGNNTCHNTIWKEKHVPCMLRVRLHLIIGAFTYIYMW